MLTLSKDSLGIFPKPSVSTTIPQGLPRAHSAHLPLYNLSVSLHLMATLRGESAAAPCALIGIRSVVFFTQDPAGWVFYTLLMYPIPQGSVEMACICFIMSGMA